MTLSILSKRLAALGKGKCPLHGKELQPRPSDPCGPYSYYRCENATCDFEAYSRADVSEPLIPAPHCARLLDPDYAQLPQQLEEQRRGIIAADVVAIALSQIAWVRRVETDVDIGVDMICELREHEEPTGLIFNAQCKAMPISAVGNNKDVSLSIRVTTARYWMIQPFAALLMVADPKSGAVLWADAKAQLKARHDGWRENGEVTLTIPRASEFNCFSTPPSGITALVKGSLRQLGSTLQERLYREEKMLSRLNRIGVDDSAQEVSKALVDRDTAVEIEELKRSLENFQTTFEHLLIRRIVSYVSVLRPRLEDAFRMSTGLYELSVAYTENSDYIELVAKLDETGEVLKHIANTPSSGRFGTLIELLKNMEQVHEQWLIFEQINAEEVLRRQVHHDTLLDIKLDSPPSA